MVMKNRIEACWQCRARPKKTDGLGLGSADLIAIVPPYGRLLAIEVKRPGYTPSMVAPEQRLWLAAAASFGAVSGIASSVDEALALLELVRSAP
jgi:hypothetical protein